MLATPRAAIEAYCAEHGLQPRFDRSNEDTTIYRNRLRHELLPILEGYNPRMRAVLAHTAEVLGGDYELLRTAVDEAWERVRTREGEPRGAGVFVRRPHSPACSRFSSDAVEFDLAAWRALPLGLQRATIREAIHRLRASLRNINWEHVERAVWLAREGTTGQKATLAAGLELEIDYRTLRIGSEATPISTLQQALLFQPDSSPGVLVAPGVTVIGGWQIAISCARRDAQSGEFATAADPWTARLDADAVGSNLILRIRQPGDRFQPQGLDGHSTKLNEFMINAKIPKTARARWPLLCSPAGIAWVCGLRVAEWAIVRPETRAVWVVRLMSVPRSQ